MNPLQIFRAGSHIASDGQAMTFTEADLAATAAAYNPTRHEAPIVIGHPTTDAPAYGWIAELTASQGALEAMPSQIDPQFAELVKAGRYKKISASFFLPDSSTNPTPGVYALRHVGFLGAAPPAVKGLRSPQFAADDAGTVTVDFSDADDLVNVSLWRRLREFLIAQFDLATADKVAPEMDLQTLTQLALEEPDESCDDPMMPDSAIPQDPTYAEKSLMIPNFEAEKAALDQRAARLAEREAELAAEKAAHARAADADFTDALIQQGRLLPRDQPGLLEVMTAVKDCAPVSFADEGAVVERTPRQWLETFLKRLPVQVDYQEHSAADSTPEPTVADFTTPPGYQVDPQQLKLHHQAQVLAAQKNIDYLVALRELTARAL